MGIFSKPKAPAPFNAEAALQRQGTADQQKVAQDIKTNRPNQYGPFGSVTWTQNPDGSFSQNTQISGDELAYRDSLKSMGMEGSLAGLSDLKNQQSVGRVNMDPTGLMGLGTAGIYGFNPTAGSMEAFKKADDYWTQVEEPRMQRQTDQLDTKLKNQGLDPTSEAYRTAANDLASQQGEARGRFVQNAQGQFFNQDNTLDTNAWNRATGLFGLGSQEAQRLFGQDLSGAGLDVTRASTLANLGRSLMPTPQTTPGVSAYNTIGIPGLDAMGALQAQQNDAWKQFGVEEQRRNAMMQGLAQLGGTVLGGPIGGQMGNMMFGGGGGGVQPFQADFTLPWQRMNLGGGGGVLPGGVGGMPY